MDKKQPLLELLKTYKTWVRNNPNVVADAETVLTWSSYYVAGKINNSPIVSELVYSLSKLLSLYNDNLIREAYGHVLTKYGLQEKIKMWLTVIHYCEVFIELYAKKKWGHKGKWTLATMLQLVKCAANLVLLYKFKEMPIQHPPVLALQRKKIVENSPKHENANDCFKLKRSGRIVRRVDGSPPVALRDWQPLKTINETQSQSLNMKRLLYAETIHVLKPLIHLLAMKAFGPNAWKQWILSFGLDITSLKLYSSHIKELSQEQRIELSRRKLCLLLYLLRSPMYSMYSQKVIKRALTSTARKIPLADFVCSPLLQYLNHWQDIYFYMWAS